MNANSLKGFQELKDSGILNNRQLEVYQAIITNPNHTDRELAEILGQDDSNYVRPRRKALLDLGLIEESGSRRCEISHFTAETWKKKSYNLEDIKARLEKQKNKNSQYYWRKIQDAEKLMDKLKDKYFSALRREQKQMSIGDFK